MESNEASQGTFREKCKSYVSPLRKMQIVSLAAIVISCSLFLLFAAFELFALLPIFLLFALLGVVGEVVAFLKIKKLKCYRCNANLAYLFIDPNYSKTSTSLIFPNGLPDNVTECPYCHADFQK
ncbi:MAG: hypothetical protein ACOX6W_09365 [Lentisphaeria bacterium]|jgi:hypothetical protein